MDIIKLNPCGYCKGVYDAISTVFDIKNKKPDKKIYCIGQIVHNRFINEKIRQIGVTILENDKKEAILSINEGVVIFSAHGTSKEILNLAKSKNLEVIDTICPFVKKGMDIITNYLNQGYDILYIGKKNHPEAIATTSLSKNIHLIESINDLNNLNIENDKIFLTNQTTISILDLNEFYQIVKKKYPNTIISDEICSSTRLRQEAILALKDIDGLIIVGDIKSNNTQNLYKIAKQKGINAILIENIRQLPSSFYLNKKRLAITSGASTPIELVHEIINFLNKN